jgi:hypothetical protein
MVIIGGYDCINAFSKDTEKNMDSQDTQSQIIKSILELCEAFEMPESAVSIIRKKCWYLADSEPEGNGKDEAKILQS